LFNRVLAPIAPFVARQLGRPEGFVGRTLMTRILNRGNRALIESALAALALDRHDAVLDVGFGGGLGLELALARGVRRAAGVDPSADALRAVAARLARRKGQAVLELACGSVTALPFADGAFDKLVSTNTIYFWPELALPCRELARVLAPGGTLVLGFSDAPKLRAFGPITRHGFALHELGAVAQALTEAGFAPVELRALRGGNTDGDWLAVARKPSHGGRGARRGPSAAQ
jgi:SAM-dependent methyltransferase